MAWTTAQKRLAAMACRAAGIDDDHRKLILRQFDHAHYDAAGKRSTEPSSKSKRLTNADFDQFIAILERSAGGQLKTGNRTYPPTHFQDKADDVLARVRFKAQAIADALVAAGVFDREGVSLAGWISKRVAQGEKDRLAQLDYHELHALITGLTAFAKGRGVPLPGARGGPDHAA